MSVQSYAWITGLMIVILPVTALGLRFVCPFGPLLFEVLVHDGPKGRLMLAAISRN